MALRIWSSTWPPNVRVEPRVNETRISIERLVKGIGLELDLSRWPVWH
jgi:hypothetical protein